MNDLSPADIVRRALRAQNRGDDETFLEALHPDIEWHVKGNPWGAPPIVRGREAIAAEMVAARQRHGNYAATLHEVRQAGDRVLVVGTVTTSDGMRLPHAWIWTLHAGKVVRVENYLSTADALADWERS